MSRYDIDPVGVRGVLSKVQRHLRDLDADAVSLDKQLTSGARASGSAVVAGALNDWAGVRGRELAAAQGAGWNAVEATVQATLAYVHGDLAMMQSAQHAAQAATVAPAGHRRHG